MNCKPGDLAYIVGCDFPENNGHIVHVLRVSKNLLAGWQVQPQAELTANAGGKIIRTRSVGDIKDCLLRPITPPEQSTDTSARESLECLTSQ